ncbi:hypothetical protein Q7Y95_08185 [Glaesserella parasuis]|nr:hypothetical protein [Glaesserella parasuis]MCT8551522.1 hypothetical protein [Glaesserella parasuis]MCT8592390.1 hypothetical protein [Glaesserella parasuis]MDP0395715.1 hypothetical protein [Glaesserella parasuis]MDP0481131.1 hypothetical protein [Glaesserella parasuis]
MSRRKQKQTDSEKLDLILEAVTSANEKIDSQNERIDALQKEVHATKKLVDDMARKNRRDAVIAGSVGGGLVAIGFELIRLKLGG